MSVCIVGNGPSELGGGNGELIDSYDVVYRCNNFTIDNFEDDYGIKTSVWVNTFARDVQYPNFKLNLDIFCPLPLNVEKYLNRYNFTNSLKMGKHLDNTEFIDVDVFEELLVDIPNPSAGVSTIWHLYKKGLITSRDQLFGFSFFKKGKQHYFDKGVQTTHDGNKEKEFIDNLNI